jgi:hypothetical protein
MATLFAFIAIVAVSLEMPATSAVLGALAFYLVGHGA